MTFYRETLPEATVLPKMHFMEEHMVPWFQQYRVGLGLMGEQGAGSIHASINGIKRAYCSIPDRLKQLLCILDEHHRHACPLLTKEKPKCKERKTI